MTWSCPFCAVDSPGRGRELWLWWQCIRR